MCTECGDRLYGHEDWYIRMKKKETADPARHPVHQNLTGYIFTGETKNGMIPVVSFETAILRPHFTPQLRRN